MAKKGDYRVVLVESFIPDKELGRHPGVHIRTLPGQVFDSCLFVACSERLCDIEKYPVGTKFILEAKLTNRNGKGDYLFSYHGDPDVPISNTNAKKFLDELRPSAR